MKKPKIYYNPRGFVSTIRVKGKSNEEVVEAYEGMIDALMDVLYVMQKEGNGEVVKHKDKSYVYFNAKDALKKAGCTE